MYIRNQQDFWAGVMFVAFGAFFASVGTEYDFGSAAQMGPGYFPTILGVILVLVGLKVSVGSLSKKAARQAVNKFAFSKLLLILGPVVLFGVLLEHLGLVPCLLLLVGISSYGSDEFTWRATIINAAVLSALCLFVFVYALELQFQMWPTFLGN
ncbi:tripartite tricarboxylate transporter TctB family protein [Pseudoduganella umbonata]|uniref:Tripartite tricarboxylate transporter TctB family protein n=1 Tax=Pseudoduganella umbonata TaxID=864828 RepID=A0A4P8HLK2_9BURK|nr:tripartite tricarboxylate transporter TctB family protein [Pseudoduganella umbonata]MBB3221606.1 hypothetical protein [Pseudoduganella umbonata]QCP09158.1 tripartite tricarboxylate transporter TctB family protein [Pseudoduganella umbonata]